MRTTVTLDPDVEEYLRRACRERRKSFKKVLNETLRETLKPQGQPPRLLPPRPMGLRPGVDPRRLGKLADELEVDARLATESSGPGYGKNRGGK